MKRKLKVLCMTSLLLILLVIMAYFLLAYYYRDGFSLNTWINGVYCTGKTVEEVSSELLSQIEAPIVIITDDNGKEYKIKLAEMDYQVDYQSVLQRFMNEQNPYLWIDNLTLHRTHEIQPIVSYDKEKLRKAFYAMLPIRTALLRMEEYYIYDSGTEGYQLYDGLTQRLDVEEAFERLLDAINRKEYEISMDSLAYYTDTVMTEEQEQTKELWEKLQQFYQCDLIYDMGAEQIEMTPEVLSEFLMAENGLPILNAEGGFVLNKEAVESFVVSLAEQYDTYKKERQFQSTRGDIVTVMGKTYGTQLNQKKEINFLLENLLSEEMYTGVKQMHIPTYTREAFVRGLDDIGDTYIEIDLTEQKLYCYVKGELKIETDIVTGNMRRGWSTPEGINYVYNKQRNRILRGEGYASPVKYWMPVNGGIGIHDANWRKEFGGEIYKKNGSHGCINIPPEIMPDLYDMVEIGTPVIMFY